MRILIIFLIILFGLLPLYLRAEITVVTSIGPLYQITQSIMQGVGEPELLIERLSAAHGFAFKPSQLRLLDRADLVIWIDRFFESGFQRLPWTLRTRVVQLELLRSLGLTGQDGHIWYSPVLLRRITQQISDALIELDPGNRKAYTRNTDELSARLEYWQQEFEPRIKAASPRYLLDHDFLRYFEKDFGIQALAVLNDANDQPVGIRALRKIEEKLTYDPASCLLTNETTASKQARNLARRFNLRVYYIGTVDPATGNRPSVIQILDQLESALINCR
ncbi:MAG: metal ABC transporter solute-binding protein, Zn/Mn family [Gammaproteobacteria bacterium]